MANVASWLRTWILVLLSAMWLTPCTALAQQPPEVTMPTSGTAVPSTDSAGHGFLDILMAGGLVGYIIMLLSIVGVALAIEQLFSLRQAVLMPPQLADKVRNQLKSEQFAQAEQLCKAQPSVLSHVLLSGLGEVDGGWSGVEKAMEDSLVDQSARLLRKIEVLSVIGNVAPMLGLLGTVIGMVMAFREVAMTQGAARAADLAEGIYLALVTTVQGLIVAIPALAVYAFFRSRVDQLVAEVSYQALHAFTPLKRAKRRARASGTTSTTIPPPIPPAERGRS